MANTKDEGPHTHGAGTLRRMMRRLQAAMSRTKRPPPLACREMVELVTAYLDGALDPAMLARFEAHLHQCDGCANYLAEMRATVAAVGEISDEQFDPVFRTRLMAALAGTAGSW